MYVPLQNWDEFQTGFKKNKIRDRQTNEQSQESEIQPYLLEQFSLT